MCFRTYERYLKCNSIQSVSRQSYYYTIVNNHQDFHPFLASQTRHSARTHTHTYTHTYTHTPTHKTLQTTSPQEKSVEYYYGGGSSNLVVIVVCAVVVEQAATRPGSRAKHNKKRCWDSLPSTPNYSSLGHPNPAPSQQSGCF